MKNYQKAFLGILAAVVIIIGGIQLYFSFSLDNQLKKTLVNRFHKATGDAYDLEVGSFNLGILGRQLSVSDIKLNQKEQPDGSSLQVSLDELNVSGIGFLKLFFDQQLSLKEIRLINPDLDITTAPQKSDTSQTNGHSLSQRLSGFTLQMLDAISIPRFQVQGLSVDYNRSDLPVKPYLSFRNSYILLQDISIDSTSLVDKRVIPSDDITTTFRDIRYRSADKLYEVSVKQLDLSSSDKSVNIQSFQLTPRLDKEQFAKQKPHEVDRITIDVKNIDWKDVAFDSLNYAKGFFARHVNLNKPDIDIYRDKRPPFPANNNPPLPREMITQIPISLNIDSLSLADGNIRYSELQPKAQEEGFIEFANLSATLKQLTNIEENWANGKTPSLNVKADVMERAQLSAQFSFSMDSNNQHITGSLEPMDMKVLNKAIQPMAFVRIDDGRILGLNFDMNLTKERASGNLTLLYEDLKISLLDRESNKETFGNKVTSLLANTFKVKSKNTGDDPRVGKIEFERDKTKSVFNYWWKSLLSGLKSSIGV